MKWEISRLEDCCISITDGDHQAPPKAQSGIPFIIISDINQFNRIDFSNARYVPIEYYNALDDKRKPQKGNVLYTVKGSFGIPVYVDEERPFVFQRDIAILKCNDKMNPQFLFYVMKNRRFYQIADALAIGSAQRAITLNTLKNMQVPLPPKETQKRIVEILSAYDDLIENNQKQIKLLEEAAQRLYKEWFVDLRFPGHENTPIVDGIPKGWEKDTIGSRFTLLSGYAFKSTEFDDNGVFRIATIKNVQDGKFDGENASRIQNIPSNMPAHCYLHDGDILLSLTGNVGRVCLMVGDDFLLNQRVAKIQTYTPAFAYCLFRSKEMYFAMCNLANGVAQQNLSPVRTGNMLFVSPPNSLVDLFEKNVCQILNKIIVLQKLSLSTARVRDKLLPRLLSNTCATCIFDG